MGRDSSEQGRGGRKNRARMNYLRQVRQQGRGGGGGGRGGGRGGRGNNNHQGQLDADGYKTGDYVSSYGFHNRNSSTKKWKPRSFLTGGMKGFLLTTNFRESDCVREAYNLLNEYDDKDKMMSAAAAAEDKQSKSEELVGKQAAATAVVKGVEEETTSGDLGIPGSPDIKDKEGDKSGDGSKDMEVTAGGGDGVS
jgi:hypothetical protein